MELKQIASWLLPAVIGIILKLSSEKELNRERIIRAVIQAICIGYFVNELCILKDIQKFTGIIAGASAFGVEFILKMVVKFRWIIFKQAIFRMFGVNLPEKNEQDAK